MNFGEKKIIVERLKKNERAYCFLSDAEKEVLHSLSVYNELLGADGTWHAVWLCRIGPIKKGGFVFRIHRDYVLPPEAPEGYRLVTKEEAMLFEMLKLLNKHRID